MIEIFKTNLHLFDGDGGASGAPAAGEGAQAATPAHSQQDNNGETAQTATEQTPDRNAEYHEMLAKYKDLDDQRVQDIVKKRLKSAKANETRMNNQMSAMQEAVAPLFARYGVNDGDFSALRSAIDSDTEYWEQAADREGLTVQQYQERQNLIMRQRQFERQAAEYQAHMQAQRQVQAWREEAEQLKGEYPEFDLETEMADDNFRSLVSVGKNGLPRMSLKAAYQAVHAQELISRAAQQAAQREAERVASTVRANGSRPRESGGAGEGVDNPGKIDVSKLTPKQMREYAERARRGERITFT